MILFCVNFHLYRDMNLVGGSSRFYSVRDGAYADFDGMLVDNFSHESDVTSLQDLFPSRP